MSLKEKLCEVFFSNKDTKREDPLGSAGCTPAQQSDMVKEFKKAISESIGRSDSNAVVKLYPARPSFGPWHSNQELTEILMSLISGFCALIFVLLTLQGLLGAVKYVSYL